MFLPGIGYDPKRDNKKFRKKYTFKSKNFCPCYTFKLFVAFRYMWDELGSDLEHGINKDYLTQFSTYKKILIERNKISDDKTIYEVEFPQKRDSTLIYLKTITTSSSTNFGSVYHENDYEVVRGKVDELEGTYPEYLLRLYSGSVIVVGEKVLYCFFDKTNRAVIDTRP